MCAVWRSCLLRNGDEKKTTKFKLKMYYVCFKEGQDIPSRRYRLKACIFILDVLVGVALWFLRRWFRALNKSLFVWWINFIEGKKMSLRSTCTRTRMTNKKNFDRSSSSRRRGLVCGWGNVVHFCLPTYLGSGEKETSWWPLFFALSDALRVKNGEITKNLFIFQRNDILITC